MLPAYRRRRDGRLTTRSTTLCLQLLLGLGLELGNPRNNLSPIIGAAPLSLVGPDQRAAGGTLCSKLKTFSGSYLAFTWRSRSRLEP